jgi:hypothetical protein
MPNKQIVPKTEETSDSQNLFNSDQNTLKPNANQSIAPKRKYESNTAKTTNAKPVLKKKKKTGSSNDDDNNDNNLNDSDNSSTKNKNNSASTHSTAGHRPVTSCTHCRQHKIKCNASEKFPEACSRCQRMNLKCEVDPQFRPKKGSQIQSLRNDVDELRSKIEFLTKNENLIAKVLQNTNPGQLNSMIEDSSDSNNSVNKVENSNIVEIPKSIVTSPSLIAKTHLQKEPILLSLDGRSSSIPLINDSAMNKTDLNVALEAAVRNVAESPAQFNQNDEQVLSNPLSLNGVGTKLTTPVNTKPISQNNLLPNTQISEFVLGDVKIDIKKAQTLHSKFIENFLPYLPIMVSNDPVELYQQSQLLFWTVMLTACLSDPEPSLYISFASLIKQLAIETCWIRTPRSTHIVQSLLILSTWPLPNQKVLDDCSYRFIGLAKSLSLQLGLHRGKFMTEFTRTQVALPDAEKWRSRTWLAVFFCEQFWSSNLGLPPSLQTDYLLESARIDQTLPKNFRCLISLAIFQAKLVNIMGLNVSGPDGLMEPANRAGPLHIMERELERLVFKLQIDDLVVEIYYLYVKLMVCLFSFLPETPSEDQTKFVTIAYHSATRIVTIMSKLLETKQLTEYPIYVRHSVTTAAFILFKLHLTPYLLPKYIDSSRQSIVTVHRLFRNMLAAWKDVENDISRTATVLEKLNFVIITHPELFTDTEGIIVRMRSHLTGSLFYDLVWNIHEARRRTIEESKNNYNKGRSNKSNARNGKGKALPLPFYNQITKDDFTAITTTTPNGTTITTLVPTDQAINNAQESAHRAGLSKPTEINGIPLAMLEATGSLSKQSSLTNLNSFTLKSQSPSLLSLGADRRSSQLPPTQQQELKKRKNPTTNSARRLKNDKKNVSVNTSRSTSMNAAVNGLAPPPLFPNNQRISSLNNNPGSDTSNEFNNTNYKNNDNNINNKTNDLNSELGVEFKPHAMSASNSLTTGLDNKPNSSLTSVSITSLDKFFESPSLPITDENTPSDNQSVTQRKSGVSGSTSQSPTDPDLLNEMFIDSIFQQSLSKPPEDDDLLGWFDMNMAPEF